VAARRSRGGVCNGSQACVRRRSPVVQPGALFRERPGPLRPSGHQRAEIRLHKQASIHGYRLTPTQNPTHKGLFLKSRHNVLGCQKEELLHDSQRNEAAPHPLAVSLQVPESTGSQNVVSAARKQVFPDHMSGGSPQSLRDLLGRFWLLSGASKPGSALPISPFD